MNGWITFPPMFEKTGNYINIIEKSTCDGLNVYVPLQLICCSSTHHQHDGIERWNWHLGGDYS